MTIPGSLQPRHHHQLLKLLMRLPLRPLLLRQRFAASACARYFPKSPAEVQQGRRVQQGQSPPALQ